MSLTDKEIMDGVLAEFSNLAAIPRKSNHEEAVSNFLKERALSFGCKVVQDEKFNLIIDKESAKVCETWPHLIINLDFDNILYYSIKYIYFNFIQDKKKKLGNI